MLMCVCSPVRPGLDSVREKEGLLETQLWWSISVTCAALCAQCPWWRSWVLHPTVLFLFVELIEPASFLSEEADFLKMSVWLAVSGCFLRHRSVSYQLQTLFVFRVTTIKKIQIAVSSLYFLTS